jgi:hypothetical protein
MPALPPLESGTPGIPLQYQKMTFSTVRVIRYYRDRDAMEVRRNPKGIIPFNGFWRVFFCGRDLTWR